MNTRFFLNFLTAPKRNAGFAMPMVIMGGLVITVAAAAIAMKGMNDQNQVTAKAQKASSVASAETAVARYTNFLNNNRGLIRYPSCTTINATTGACSDPADSTTVKSWATANAASANLVGIGPGTTPVSGGGSCNTPGIGGTLPANYQTVSSSVITSTWAKSDNRFDQGAWQSLPDGGRFRLVSYTPNASWNPTVAGSGVATLTVEGEHRGAKSRLELELPVTAQLTSTAGSSSTGFPGLWARGFSFNGTPTVDAQVFDSSQCVTGATGMNSSRLGKIPSSPLVVTGTGNGNHSIYQLSSTNATSTPMAAGFPTLPTAYPSGVIANIPTALIPALNLSGIGWVNFVGCPVNSDVTFPRNGDRDSNGNTFNTNAASNTAPANATYNYYVCSSSGDSFELQNDTVTLGRSGQETLKFYLAGTFETKANGDLTIGGSGSNRTISRFYIASPGRLIGGSNGSAGIPDNPKALQFYIYGPNVGTTNRVDVGGNNIKSMFIFAPQAGVTVSGTGDFAGAIWANSYNAGGNGRISQGIFDATGLDVNPGSNQVLTYSIGANPVSFREVEAAVAAD